MAGRVSKTKRSSSSPVVPAIMSVSRATRKLSVSGRFSTEKRPCVYEWSKSRFAAIRKLSRNTPNPLPPQSILTCHATISYCIRNYSLLLDNTTIPLPALTLSFSIFCV
jgi:hypothetical protein